MLPLIIIAILPFLFFSGFLLFNKLNILKSSFLLYFSFLFLALLIWQIQPFPLLNSLLKGFLLSLDIFFIIFGAILFLNILNRHKTIDHSVNFFQSISVDYRILTIFLAWFLENFIEGIAGFGTPATLVAPILVALGINPISAVVLALFGNSVSVAFGAAGTPIRVGFSSLDYSGVPLITALYNGIGLLVPVFMSWFIVKTLKRPFSEFWEILPFSLWSGFLFVVCSYLTVFLGQEFPSIIGSVISFLIILITTKLGFLLPSTSISFIKRPTSVKKQKPFQVFLPYLILILLLIAGKFSLGNIDLLLLGGQKHSLNLFNPGLAFFTTSIIFIFAWRLRPRTVKKSLLSSLKKSLHPFLVIFLMSSMVQLLIMSGENSSGLSSIIDTLAQSIKYFNLIIFAPIIGAFGSFITGSATISNLLFGQILYQSSQTIGLSSIKILSLELVGAGFGNMIALADVITAETVVGLKNKESLIIKIITPYCFFLLLILIFVALFIF